MLILEHNPTTKISLSKPKWAPYPNMTAAYLHSDIIVVFSIVSYNSEKFACPWRRSFNPVSMIPTSPMALVLVAKY